MTIQSGFFQSINGDRRYRSDFFASYFASFVGNGVFANPSTNLQVLSSTNMTVNVSPGKGWINGYYIVNSANIPITVGTADGVLNRVDRIVFALDFNSREISIYLKRGTPSSNPSPPILDRNSTVYELALADISIPAGTTSINQGLITDQRLNANLCGIVTGLINQVDTSTLFVQYQTQFNDFLGQLETALEGDVAGNLLTMINNVERQLNNHEDLQATITQRGHVRLSNDTNSTSEILAPTMRALNEVKQYANDGKTLVAAAIVGRGGNASSSDTFAQLAAAIGTIGGGISRVQRLQGTFPQTGISVTVNIDTVDINKAVVIVDSVGIGNRADLNLITAEITTPNNVVLTRGNAAGTSEFNVIYNLTVIEFDQLRSFQKGTNLWLGSGINENATININSVNVNKSLLFVSTRTPNTTNTLSAGLYRYRIASPTTLRFGGENSNNYSSWFVAEFN